MEFHEILAALAITPADGPHVLKTKLLRADTELTTVAADVDFALSRGEKLVARLNKITNGDSIVTVRLLLEDADATSVLHIAGLAQFTAKLIHARNCLVLALKAMKAA